MKSDSNSITNIKSKGFLIDSLMLSSAPLITQITGFFIIPFITHLFSPEAFGISAAFAAIISPFGAIVTLSYPAAIVMEKDEIGKNNVMALCILSTFFFSFISFILTYIFRYQIADLFNLRILVSYMWLVPLNVFIWGAMLTFRYWNLAESRYGNIAVCGIAENYTNNAFLIFVGYFYSKAPIILILGKLLGSIIRLIILCRHFTISKIKLILKSISIRKLFSVAKDHKQFLFLGTPNTFLLRMIDEIPTYLLLYFFSSSVLGFYSLGLRVLNVPISLLGSSISEVYFQREGKNSEINHENLERMMVFLISISIFPFIVLASNGEDLFYYIFGKDWSKAGIYAQFLSFYLFANFITILALPISGILRKQQFNLIFSLVNLGVTTLAIYIGGTFHNEYIAVILISLFGGITNIIYALTIFRFTKWSSKNVLNKVKPYILISLLFLAIIIFTELFLSQNIYIRLIVILPEFLLYYLYVMKTQDEFKKIILLFRNLVKKIPIY